MTEEQWKQMAQELDFAMRVQKAVASDAVRDLLRISLDRDPTDDEMLHEFGRRAAISRVEIAREMAKRRMAGLEWKDCAA